MRHHKSLLLTILLLSASFLISACTSQPTPTPTASVESTTAEPTTAEPSLASSATSTDVLPISTLTKTPEPTSTNTHTSLPPIPEDILFSIGDPYASELGSQAIDVLHYDLAIQLYPGYSNAIEGQASITMQALYTPLDIIALDFKGFEVLDVSIDGIGVDYSRIDKKLIIEPLLPFIEGETFTVVISYAGKPLEEPSRFVPFIDHLGMFFANAQNVFVLAEPDGAHYWFPCNDHPRDKATFNIVIQVPEDFMAVANGLLVSTVPQLDQTTIFAWEHSSPMAPYLAAFAVGKYEEISITSPAGFEITSYVFEDTTAGFETELKDIAEALDWFSELLIPYPYDSFGYVVVNGFGASLETQSMVILDENMISEFVMIHELVHMWFGNWVSLDSWGEMWRNEGVTNYFSLLWIYRDESESLMTYMENYEIDALTWDPVEPLSNLSPGNLFGNEAYNFAMLVTHKLRMKMGDEAFFNGMRLYLERYGGGTASDEDFIEVMEEVSGLDLETFFEEWLNYSSTIPLR